MAAAPTVSPTIGEASYVVTVTGANLTVDNLQITNGASAVALPDQVDPTTFKFTATAPANSSQRTTHTVTGVKSDGVSYSFQITFDAAPLKLTSADVTTVDIDGGTMITVTGTGLTNTTWTWNDNPIRVSVTGGVTASVQAPKGGADPTGTLTASKGGKSSSLDFTYATVFKAQVDFATKTLNVDEVANFQPISAVNGSGNYTYAITPTLPTGLTFTNGVIGGKTSVSGSGSYKVTITDTSKQKTAFANFALLVVTAKPTVTSVSPDGQRVSWGGEVDIIGTGLSKAINVSVGGSTAIIKGTPAANKLTVTLPKVSQPGQKNLIVFTSDIGSSDPFIYTYTESGDEAWILSYDKATMASRTMVLGLRGEYGIEQSWGLLSPTWRVEYRRLLSGDVTQTMSYATEGASSYALTTTASDHDTLSAALGLKARSKGDVTGSLEYLLSGGVRSGLQGQGVRGMLRVGF